MQQLILLVVAGTGPSLLGRDWLQHIKLNWSILNHVSQTINPSLDSIIAKHAAVFDPKLGLIKGATAKIHVDQSATPQFCKARSVPYALHGRIEQELACLEQCGIIERVEFSDWATPVVPVFKQDGSVRLCGDYKLTVSCVAKLDTYPLPRIDDLFASLAGGQQFSKLDLAHAYQKIALEEASKKYVLINTHKGFYQYNRLPFGVASAPSIFQKTMEGILQGIEHVMVYIDDILVTGRTEAEHLQTLQNVLARLQKAGVRLKKSKCIFMLSSVEYLGHRISAAGLHSTEEKVKAIREAPTPTSLTQLGSFLGIINYYSKFRPHLSTMLAPLYKLLQRIQTWHWGTA